MSSMTSPSTSLLPEPRDDVRYCAYCIQICGYPIKKCGGCKKRAYCSKECQQKDWSSGQCHKKWCCQLEYGEEGIDWEVVPVPGKGLGVVAKRFLPAGFRIIVEPVFTDPHGHPGINDLGPKGAALEEKFKRNSNGGHPERDGGKPFLGLRSARINHSCRPNAFMGYDEVARVKIIAAQRDIQPGEEVSVVYTDVSELELDTSPSLLLEDFDDIQKNLKRNWGFTCPADCYCNNPDLRKLILEGRVAYRQLLLFGSKGRLEEALKAGDRLIEIHEQLNISWVHKTSIRNLLVDVAVSSSKTEERARKYLEEALKVTKIISPYSEKTKMQEELLEGLDEYFYIMPKKSKMSMMKSSFYELLSADSNK